MLEPIRPVRLADTIAEQIQTMILEGALKPGEKLIAERELAEALGVSRPSLREGLAILEEKGLLTTAKSGTMVARFLNRLSDPLASLLADDERVSADYFEYRLAMETEATALAARRATTSTARRSGNVSSGCASRMPRRTLPTIVSRVLGVTDGRGANIAVEAVGAQDPINTAIECVCSGGTVTLIGNVSPKVEIPLQRVVSRQLVCWGRALRRENIRNVFLSCRRRVPR